MVDEIKNYKSNKTKCIKIAKKSSYKAQSK